MQKLDDGAWHRHYWAVLLYVAVVVVAAPMLLGLALNEVLIGAERRDGQLRRWHYALGARDARDAWDYLFQRYHEHGAWVLVHLKAAPPAGGGARVVIGRYGRGAAAGQSPVTEHDLFLRDLWIADEAGSPVRRFDPPRSLWVAKSEIAELYLLEQDAPKAAADPPRSDEKKEHLGKIEP